MSALANILVDLGYEVYGVDYNKKYFTEATFRKSIIIESFDGFTLKDDYFYIIGNAFKIHEITTKIKDLNYKFQYYPEFLETFFKMKKIGISGSHGKTTTTSFTSQLTTKKINALIGDGSGFGNKNAKYFLFEACEYQNHFLNYTFDYLVILNIDYDHPDFFKNSNEYLYAFQKAALNAKRLIINYDDPNCKKIIHKDKITFGFNPNADVTIRQIGNKLHITFLEDEFEINFSYFGKYMAYDLVAGFIVCYLIGDDVADVVSKVNLLKLPSRRFDEHKLKNGNVLINDYAHHPTEISVVLQALKNKYVHKRIIAVYQGHTYSRTMTFYDEYVKALKLADMVFIMPTFSSIRENDQNPYLLLNADNSFLKYDREVIKKLLEDNDLVVVFLGAGDIDVEFIFLTKN